MAKKYLNPLFKFLENKHKKHADNLLQNGNIRIATLHEFRNSTLYKNTTSDENEGKLWIDNYYNLYEGYAKKANGLLPFFYPNHRVIKIYNDRYAGHIDLPNMHIYCTSMRLFSGSILQAASEDKHACVMIYNPEKFFKVITKAISLPFIKSDCCVYRGKNLQARFIEEIDPHLHSETNKYLKNFFNIAFLKPQEYSNHTEFRTIWSDIKNLPYQYTAQFLKNKSDHNHNNRVKAIMKNIAELSNFCLEVDISKVNIDTIFSKNGSIIEGRVHHIDGEDSYFEIYQPFEFFSPIVIEEDGERKLGFLAPSNTINARNVYGKNSYCEDALLVDKIDNKTCAIYCVTPLDKIKKISFITKEHLAH